MSSNYPTSFDDLLDNQPVVDDVTIFQAAWMNNIQDAVDNLQEKVGIDSSGAPASHDYKINILETNVLNGDHPVTVDSESNSMIKAHAYKAQTAGFVNVYILYANNGILYVDNTNDPAGAGVAMGKMNPAVGGGFASAMAFVPKNYYFEVTASGGTPFISWTPLVVGGGAPVDQD